MAERGDRLYAYLRHTIRPPALLLGEWIGYRQESLLSSRLHACQDTLDHPRVQGYNTYGQVGDGSIINRLVPTLVSYEGWWLQVATGDNHACGIRSDFSAWCWVRALRRRHLRNGLPVSACVQCAE